MKTLHTGMIRYLLLVVLVIAIEIESSPSTRKNHELMMKLGFTRVKTPNSHHRKRLAVESRHHVRSDDSHMFIIKLPPNPHYYAHNRPNSVVTSGKNIPVAFKSNGKPAKVYHWNIPVIKKIVSKKYKSHNNDDIDLENPDSWNEVFDKPEKERKPAKPTYYVPSSHTKKASFMKYFPGNGKLHSFYVIDSSKKSHYHRLLP